MKPILKTKHRKGIEDTCNHYFHRFGISLPTLGKPIYPDTKTIITIPCYNETHTISTLNSLAQCDLPRCSVEVIVFINASEADPPDIISINQKTFEEIKMWISKSPTPGLEFHVLMDNKLNKKHAGVGLARKILMDLALQRMASIEMDGAIICLDADCTVKPNYLLSLENHFFNAECDIATIYYEHHDDAAHPYIKQGIIAYELFLRYYVAGLQLAQFPFAYHTVGSSMGIRASNYALAGGMNKRKAGEDFYFLHKVFPHGNVHVISDTEVYPSPRMSDRVPFGTGRAMIKWVEGEKKQTAYDPKIFLSLKVFLERVEMLYQCNEEGYQRLIGKTPVEVQEFLSQNNFKATWKELNEKTTSPENFVKRFYQWCNGFMVLKYVHFARDQHVPNIPIADACIELLEIIGKRPEQSSTPENLLAIFRQLDKE